MKKKCKLIVGLLIAATLFSGCGKEKPDMEQQTVQAKITNVEIENPTMGTLKDEYKYSGSIEAKDTVDVTASMTGKVNSVNFKEGDKVRKDDVLFTIDTKDLQTSINTSKASLDSANASIQSAQTSLDLANGASMQTQLENAKSAITNAERSIENNNTSIKNAEIAVDNAKTALDKTQNTYDINKQLFDAGGLSKQSLDDTENALTSAKNSYQTALNSVDSAKTALAQSESTLEQAKKNYDILSNQTSKENVERAQDTLNQAQASKKTVLAQIDASESKLADAVVKSPISGTISACNVTEGAMLSNAKAPFTIVDLSSVDVQVNVSEDLVANIKKGDGVSIIISSLSSDVLAGSITDIASVANTDGTFTVKVELPNTDGKYKAGMFAEVYFAKNTSTNAVTVPRNAIMRDGDDYYAFIVNDGKATRVAVEIGIDTGDTIEVTKGISASDKVVTKGQTYLEDGAEVKVVSDNGTEITEATTEPTTVADDKKAKKGKEDK